MPDTYIKAALGPTDKLNQNSVIIMQNGHKALKTRSTPIHKDNKVIHKTQKGNMYRSDYSVSQEKILGL